MAAPIDVRIVADFSHSDWITIGIPVLAGLLGAVLGGAIGLFAQWRASEAEDARLKAAERERQRSVALSLLIKVGMIYSHYKILNSQVAAGLGLVHEGKFDMPWQAVQGLANLPEYVEFGGEELILLYNTTPDRKLFNDLLMKDELHNAFIKGFEVYGIRRQQLVDAIPPGRMQGIVGEIRADKGFMLTFGARMAELDDMIDSMVAWRKTDQEDAFEILSRLSELFNTSLDLKFVPTKKVLGHEESVISAL